MRIHLRELLKSLTILKCLGAQDLLAQKTKTLTTHKSGGYLNRAQMHISLVISERVKESKVLD